MDTADTPISFFAEHSGTHYETLAYELSRARLRLFVLGEVLDETRCLAEDLMTGDHFYVNMTPEMASHHDLGDVILGNIFQNQSLCMNYEKSFRLSPLSRNKLHTILQQCLDWFLIQGPDLTWSDFMAANPLFVRRIVSLVSNNPAAVAFPYKTAIKDYKPPRMTPRWTGRNRPSRKSWPLRVLALRSFILLAGCGMIFEDGSQPFCPWAGTLGRRYF